MVGVMEAATLGLSEEVGLLRDNVVQRAQEQERLLGAVRSVAGCLEDVAAASSTFATALSNRLRQEGFVGTGR